MTCPWCGSQNIRQSRKESAVEFWHSWRGLQRFRCRDCRRSFRVPVSPAERSLPKPAKSKRSKSKRTRGWEALVQKPAQRRAIEVILFIGMLLVFYVIFVSVIDKDGAGFLNGSQFGHR